MEEFIRDYAMTAALLGMFAFAWFGWAQQDPPKSKKWPIALGIGSGVNFLIATAGGLIAWKNWGGPSVLKADGAFENYMAIFIIEFVVIALATLITFYIRKQKYIATIVSFIVGVHFFPLAPVFQDNAYYLLAVMVTAASIIPLFISKKVGISIVTLTGVGVGTSLFIFAIRGLIMAIS